MEKSIISSVISVLISSLLIFLISIFDNSFLPLGFYVWILLPALLFIDFIFWIIEKIINFF